MTDSIWIPEVLSSPNSTRTSTSPSCSSFPIDIPTKNNHMSVSANHSDDSNDDGDDDDDVNHENNEQNPSSIGFNLNHLHNTPSQWNTSINGNGFLPLYNHHHRHHHHHQPQQQQQTTTYVDDDLIWYERLRSMAASIGSEQQSSSDSSLNDIQQHHQLFNVYSQHLPPSMMTAVTTDPHTNYYSTHHSFDPYHHHIPEYQTMFSF